MLRVPALASPGALACALLALAPASFAGTLFVDSSLASGLSDGTTWANAFRGADALQDALAAAVAGDDIFVKQGTYKPTSGAVRSVSFQLKSQVSLYGGFLGGEASPAERPPAGSAPSMLSGDLAGDDASGLVNDNSYHVINASGSGATAVLDGFVVSGGNANGSGNNNKGGGILCISGSSPTVRQCLFAGNRCTFGGGAGYINNSAPSFTDCSFESNSGGSFGGAFDIATAGAVRFDRCFFSGNSAARAGALEIFSSNGPQVVNCVFVDNLATGGSGGGGLWIGSGGNTKVLNCTIVGNRSTSQTVGGLRVQSAAAVTVVNCILWDNEGPGGAQNPNNQIGGTSQATYCVVEGGISGTGNSAADPQFTSPLAGDFSLASGSAAIDAGQNSAVPAGITLDYSGAPRFVDDGSTVDTGSGSAPLVDIGAFEATGLQTILAYCFGDGSGTLCPCSNGGAPGRGCANGTYAGGALLTASGVPSISGDSLVLQVTASIPNQPGVFFLGNNAVAGGAGALFGDGLRCAGGAVCRLQVVQGDFFGDLVSSVSVAATCALSAGDVRRAQWWYRDPAGSLCGNGFNLSNGLELLWLP
jgi:hypothetical protein